ncbi:MAG: hypothetical protein QGF74_00470 [Candidatus Nanoarchaeia archaeon]|jgi:hypothetical protein|nr:hypothetical protein [Candidatus Nanoarchaeia archaeon]|tara:strand:+ start:26636 stop:26944 length:309 start_codon:yes stop_codon:yes gene_type:complete
MSTNDNDYNLYVVFSYAVEDHCRKKNIPYPGEGEIEYLILRYNKKGSGSPIDWIKNLIETDLDKVEKFQISTQGLNGLEKVSTNSHNGSIPRRRVEKEKVPL